jgi:hypothetical protein
VEFQNENFPDLKRAREVVSTHALSYFHNFTNYYRLFRFWTSTCNRKGGRKNTMPNLAAVTSLEVPTPSYIVTDPADGNVADLLSDALLDHMLDCPTCLDGDECRCATWQKFQNEIKFAGKPKRGLVLAF